ncbi:MAG TPA: PD-(D/E)XK nuclease family protein [Bacillota bacterium]|nr:PD-(D/E)XK nuclease family protein [Bacillota bacterium]
METWKTEAVLEPASAHTPPDRLGTSPEVAELVAERLSWQYPYKVLATVPAKATVTEMKRRFGTEDPASGSLPGHLKPGNGKKGKLALRPHFLQEETGLSPAEKGTAMHLVMQHLRLEGDLSLEGIRQQAALLEQRELLTGPQAQSLNYQAMTAFFTTELGQKMVTNPCLRELPFTMAFPARELYPGLDNLPEEQILVQGVIDCLVEDSNGFILLDYKTDRVTPDNLEALVNNYRGQLRLYAQAVETLLGKEVREKYLYFFATGQLVRVS